MRFYKALLPFKAISFDLDDTLYNNGPVIEQAELAMQKKLRQLLPQLGLIDPDFWWLKRKELALLNPDVRHDVSRWRLLSLEQGLTELGIRRCEAAEIAELAFAAFYKARSNLTVPQSSHQLLKALAERYPLVAITNGNADLELLQIRPYFQHSYRAGPGGQMKPFPDMFLRACQQLAIQPRQLLHIGDNSKADVQGALNAGCQAVWLRQQTDNQTLLLPHLQIDSLQQLTALL
jgi:HAD superfamily hydrolase (TIGR01549 family)